MFQVAMAMVTLTWVALLTWLEKQHRKRIYTCTTSLICTKSVDVAIQVENGGGPC